MKKSIITDTKLTGRSHKLIRTFFFGAALVLGATLLGATIAAGFDATYIKTSLAIMTIPAYVYFFLSRFCHRIEIRPGKKEICFYPLLKKEPRCFAFDAVTSGNKKTLQKNRILYRFRVARSQFTICSDRQGEPEKFFAELFDKQA